MESEFFEASLHFNERRNRLIYGDRHSTHTLNVYKGPLQNPTQFPTDHSNTTSRDVNIGGWPFKDYTPRLELHVTHGNPRSPTFNSSFSPQHGVSSRALVLGANSTIAVNAFSFGCDISLPGPQWSKPVSQPSPDGMSKDHNSLVG
jgi:hypothetical protein